MRSPSSPVVVGVPVEPALTLPPAGSKPPLRPRNPNYARRGRGDYLASEHGLTGGRRCQSMPDLVTHILLSSSPDESIDAMHLVSHIVKLDASSRSASPRPGRGRRSDKKKAIARLRKPSPCGAPKGPTTSPGRPRRRSASTDLYLHAAGLGSELSPLAGDLFTMQDLPLRMRDRRSPSPALSEDSETSSVGSYEDRDGLWRHGDAVTDSESEVDDTDAKRVGRSGSLGREMRLAGEDQVEGDVAGAEDRGVAEAPAEDAKLSAVGEGLVHDETPRPDPCPPSPSVESDTSDSAPLEFGAGAPRRASAASPPKDVTSSPPLRKLSELAAVPTGVFSLTGRYLQQESKPGPAPPARELSATAAAHADSTFPSVPHYHQPLAHHHHHHHAASPPTPAPRTPSTHTMAPHAPLALARAGSDPVIPSPDPALVPSPATRRMSVASARRVSKSVSFQSSALSVVLAFESGAPPQAILRGDRDQPTCLAFSDPGDEYFARERERRRERDEDERRYVHGVVVHGWTPYSYAYEDGVHSVYQEVIRVEDIRLKARTTVGVTIVVRNLEFTKRVVVRYSFDRWRTWTECEANYFGKVFPTEDLWDRFLAEIEVDPELFKRDPLALTDGTSGTGPAEDPIRGTPGGRMLFAVRYESPGAGEWWDNNRGRNFEVEFRRRRRQGAGGNPDDGFGKRGARREARKTDRVRKKESEWERTYGVQGQEPATAREAGADEAGADGGVQQGEIAGVGRPPKAGPPGRVQ